MSARTFPGTQGPLSPDRFPMYGVVAGPKRRDFRVTVAVRVRGERGMSTEGGPSAQSYLPETYKTQSAADRVMRDLNMRVYREVLQQHNESVR